MLDFIVRNRSPVVRGFSIHGRRSGGIHGNRLRGGANLQLDVQCVGLLGNQLQIAENFFLEPLSFNNQIEVVSGESVEVEDTVFVAGSDHRFIGCKVGEDKGCAWNDCAR